APRRVAVLVLGGLLDLLADRPHADRAADPDEATGAAGIEALQMLQGERIDLDIALGRDLGARLDLRLGVIVDRPDIDRARNADEAARDPDDEGLHVHGVGRVYGDALAAVGEALVQAVEDGVAADDRVGLHAEQGDADGTRDADEAAGAGGHD